jgi:hypothetical protein
MVGNVYHPKLINALKHVVASKDKQSEHFEFSLKGIIEDHLDGLLDWLKTIETILPELGNREYKSVSKIHANSDEDFSLCQMAIDDWEILDRAVGMRYNALIKRCSKLSTVTVRQITSNQLNSHKDEIKKVSDKANYLAEHWKKVLSNHAYHKIIANQLEWLSNVSVDELVKNYERWEKEKL